MKKLFIILIFFIVGCDSRNKYGDCIGAFSNKDPKLNYELSVWNAVIGVLLSETIIVPVYIVSQNMFCPYGYKEKPPERL